MSNFASLFAEIGTALSAYGAGGAQGLQAYQEQNARLLQQRMDQDFKRETQERDIAAQSREAEINRAFSREMETIRIAGQQEATRAQIQSAERIAQLGREQDQAGIESRERISKAELDAQREMQERQNAANLLLQRDKIEGELKNALALQGASRDAAIEQLKLKYGFDKELTAQQIEGNRLTQLALEAAQRDTALALEAVKGKEARETQAAGANIIAKKGGTELYNSLINRSSQNADLNQALSEAAAREGKPVERYIEDRINEEGPQQAAKSFDLLFDDFAKNKDDLVNIYGPNYTVPDKSDHQASALQARRRSSLFDAKLAQLGNDATVATELITALGDLSKVTTAPNVAQNAQDIAQRVVAIENEIQKLEGESGYPDMLLDGSTGRKNVDLLRARLQDLRARTTAGLSNARALLAERVDFTNLSDSVIGQPTMGGQPGEEAAHNASVTAALGTDAGKQMQQLILELQQLTPDQYTNLNNPEVTELVKTMLGFELPGAELGQPWGLRELLDLYRNGQASVNHEDYFVGQQAKNLVESIATKRDEIVFSLSSKREQQALVASFDESFDAISKEVTLPEMEFTDAEKASMMSRFGELMPDGKRRMTKASWASYISMAGAFDIMMRVPDFTDMEIEDELDVFSSNLSKYFGFDRNVVAALEKAKEQALGMAGEHFRRNTGTVSPIQLVSPGALRGVVGITGGSAEVGPGLPGADKLRSDMQTSIYGALFKNGAATPAALADPSTMTAANMQEVTGVSPGTMWGINTSSEVRVPLTTYTTVTGAPIFTPKEALDSTKDGVVTIYDVALAFEAAGLAVQGSRVKGAGGTLDYAARELPIVPYGFGTDDRLQRLGVSPKRLQELLTTRTAFSGVQQQPGMAGVFGGPAGAEQYRYGPEQPGRFATTLRDAFSNPRDPDTLRNLTRATLVDRYLAVDVPQAVRDGTVTETQGQFLTKIQERIRKMKPEQMLDFVMGGSAFSFQETLSEMSGEVPVYDPTATSYWSEYLGAVNIDDALRSINEDISTVDQLKPGTYLSVDERGEADSFVTTRSLLDSEKESLLRDKDEVLAWSKAAPIAGQAAEDVFAFFAGTISAGFDMTRFSQLGNDTGNPVDYAKALELRAGQFEKQSVTELALPEDMLPNPGQYRSDVRDFVAAAKTGDLDRTLSMMFQLNNNAGKGVLEARKRGIDPNIADRTFAAAWKTMSEEFRMIHRLVTESNQVLGQTGRDASALHAQLRVDIPLEVFQKANPVEQTVYLWSALMTKRRANRGK